MEEKNKGGRLRIELTEEQIIQVEALAAKTTVRGIADYFGIDRSVFYGIMKRNPEVLRRYRMGKARKVDHVGNKLLEMVDGYHIQAIKLFLLTQGARYGWSIPSNGNVNISVGDDSDSDFDSDSEKKIPTMNIKILHTDKDFENDIGKDFDFIEEKEVEDEFLKKESKFSNDSQ